MNKNVIRILGTLALSALLLGGCTPAIGSIFTHLGENDAAEITLFGESDALRDDVVVPGTPLMSLGGSSATLYNTTNQLYFIDFNYMVDVATVASGISFNSIVDTTANDFDVLSTLSPRPMTNIRVLPTGTGTGSRVFFNLDLSSCSNPARVWIKGDVLTANDGAIKRDADGDLVYGEAGQDDYCFNVNISTASGAAAPTVPTTPLYAAPLAVVAVSETGLLASGIYDIADYATAGNYLTFTASDTGTPPDPANPPAGTLPSNRVTVDADAASVSKMVDGTWTPVGSSTTYVPATLIGTISLTTAPAVGEAYKIVLDLYKIYESTTIRGYVHHGTYHQKADDPARYQTYYIYFDRGFGSRQNFTIAAGGNTNARYFDITTANAPFDMSTITANSFKLALSGATLGPDGSVSANGDYFCEYSIQNLVVGAFSTYNDAVYSFRIYLSPLVHSYSSYDIWVSPSVISRDTSTQTGATARRNFGDPSAANDGWYVY